VDRLRDEPALGRSGDVSIAAETASAVETAWCANPLCAQPHRRISIMRNSTLSLIAIFTLTKRRERTKEGGE